MLKIRELVSFVRHLLSVIADITCYTNDAGKPIIMEILQCGPAPARWRGQVGLQVGISNQLAPHAILSAIFVEAFIQQKTLRFLVKHCNYFFSSDILIRANCFYIETHLTSLPAFMPVILNKIYVYNLYWPPSCPKQATNLPQHRGKLVEFLKNLMIVFCKLVKYYDACFLT